MLKRLLVASVLATSVAAPEALAQQAPPQQAQCPVVVFTATIRPDQIW